jgi:hypothetical protein
MGIFTVSEQTIQTHIQSALQPGEHVQQIVLGIEKPFWTQDVLPHWRIFWKNYLIATTNQRVVYIEYGGLLSGFKAKSVDSVGFNEGIDAKLGWGIFKKNLTVKAASRSFSRTVEVHRFHRGGNLDAATATVTTLTQVKQLGAGQP